MTIYVVAAILNIVLLIMPKLTIRGRKRCIEVSYTGCMICLLFLIMALRGYSVGVDTAPYARIYTKIAGADSIIDAVRKSRISAYGYVILCRVLSLVSDNPRIAIVTCSAIISIFLYKESKKSDNPLMYVLLWQTTYMFAFGMNANRQVVATIIGITGMHSLIENKKNAGGWIMLFISIMVHPASVIIPLAFLLAGILMPKRNLLMIPLIGMAAAVITMYLFIPIINIFLRFFPSYNLYMDSSLSYNVRNVSGGGKIGILYLFFILVCLIMTSMFKYWRNVSLEKYDKECLMIFSFISMFGLLNPKNTIVFRLAMFLVPLGISLIVNFKKYYATEILSDKKSTRIDAHRVFVIVVNVILFIYMLLSLADNQSGVTPYIIGDLR